MDWKEAPAVETSLQEKIKLENEHQKVIGCYPTVQDKRMCKGERFKLV
jgi:hypothetical protein